MRWTEINPKPVKNFKGEKGGEVLWEADLRMEAATGLEPVNNGFADRCLSHLAMPPF
jgi:hypothetical protein